jgi:hypothetical protein
MSGARPPVAWRGKSGGPCTFSSLGEEAAQQRDGQLKSSRLIYTERRLTARLTTVLGRSQSEQSPPDGIATQPGAYWAGSGCGGRALDLAPYTAE